MISLMLLCPKNFMIMLFLTRCYDSVYLSRIDSQAMVRSGTPKRPVCMRFTPNEQYALGQHGTAVSAT